MIDRSRNEHGHWAGFERDGVQLWIDQEVLMLRAKCPRSGDPVELSTHEALDIAIAILKRVRAIEEVDGDPGETPGWDEVVEIASPDAGTAPP